MQNKRRVGTEKEELAIAYLEEQGATILSRNFFFHGGEVDLIAWDGEYLCFIEVKYRKTLSFGYPEEAVTVTKQRKILKGARVFLHQNHYAVDTPCRFDVISIYKEEISWLKDAFSF
ncbi:MAG: YraN family protein [Lachnospiraceae bacterium]|nr:YraN family protein [Lachnospiraceae bacterium]